MQAFGCEHSPIKIGFSENIAERHRLIQLRIKAPLRVLAHYEADWIEERQLHERFADARLISEWFRPVPELLTLIDRVRIHDSQGRGN